MATPTILRPVSEDELRDIVSAHAGAGARIALAGGGSKAQLGAPCEAQVVDMTGFAGVVDYDAAELVLTVRPGTPLDEVQALVAGQNQMLAFDPFDHGPIYGEPAGCATIGGVVAGGVGGSRRLSGGAPRDHLLGFRAVSGRGETFVAGAKVVKNVTGYDLPKLAAGSWGRLFAMTELTLKVLPRPRTSATYVVEGLDAVRAVAAMAAAMGSQIEVAAAAHLPAGGTRDRSLTGLRIQGFGPSVAARGAALQILLGSYGTVECLGERHEAELWDDLRTMRVLPADLPLWRANVPPSAGPAVAAAVEALGAQWLFDWAGGLVWIAGAIEPILLRDTVAGAGGHAMLVRAPEPMRRAVPALHPAPPGLAALEARVRRAFDPSSVFETGRF